MFRIKTEKNLVDLVNPVKEVRPQGAKFKDFGLKINPSGSIKFIAEVKHKGKSKRKTVGTHPIFSLLAIGPDCWWVII